MLIFSAILIYTVYCVFSYLQSDPVRPYEVSEGTLSENVTYRGIALRDETIVTTSAAGYLNYYAREGEHVAVGDLVLVVDELGTLTEYLESMAQGENTLSSEQLAEFRSDIVDFMHGFDITDFSSVYDFKYSLKGTILRLANANMLESLTSSLDVSEAVQVCYASQAGIVAYWTDGYEALTADQITLDILEGTDYQKVDLVSTEQVVSGAPAYKICTDENWSIIIGVEDQETGEALEEEGYIKVRFLKNQDESWASVSLLQNEDGNFYVELSFNNSMVTFISERYLEIELLLEGESGLKIPNSAIAYQSFYLVPEEYLTQGGDSDADGVLRQVYLEDGTVSVEFVEADPYSYDEDTGEYYLDTTILAAGDVLVKPDGQSTFIVSKTATLIGVYNMNKGYADFREIEILAQNEEYAIVKSNTTYGLNAYDNIVLDAASVTDEQFLYQ